MRKSKSEYRERIFDAVFWAGPMPVRHIADLVELSVDQTEELVDHEWFAVLDMCVYIATVTKNRHRQVRLK